MPEKTHGRSDGSHLQLFARTLPAAGIRVRNAPHAERLGFAMVFLSPVWATHVQTLSPSWLKRLRLLPMYDLTYRCAQEHDKRLDWLVKAPDWLLMDLMEHGECPWRLLAIRAGYVKLGLLGKY